jgi:palmitoyl-protein thioesterase
MNNDPRRSSQGPGRAANATEAARYKRNFLRLRNATFAIGDADDTIIPWQSALWGFYTEEEWIGKGSIEPLQASNLWKDDWIGLRALSESGRLELLVAPGVKHTDWAHSQATFEAHVWPRLPRSESARLVEP